MSCPSLTPAHQRLLVALVAVFGALACADACAAMTHYLLLQRPRLNATNFFTTWLKKRTIAPRPPRCLLPLRRVSCRLNRYRKYPWLKHTGRTTSLKDAPAEDRCC